MSQASDLALEIYTELDSPEDTSANSIEYWLKTSVGKLNLLLDLEVLIVSDDFSPQLTEEQSEIYKAMFEINYYERQIRKNLGAASYDTVMEVKEGGRTIRVANKNDIAKSYMGIKAGLNDQLQQLILAYKMNAVYPTQIYLENPLSQSGGYGLCGYPNYEV